MLINGQAIVRHRKGTKLWLFFDWPVQMQAMRNRESILWSGCSWTMGQMPKQGFRFVTTYYCTNHAHVSDQNQRTTGWYGAYGMRKPAAATTCGSPPSIVMCDVLDDD
jgi:hypothetical protein